MLSNSCFREKATAAVNLGVCRLDELKRHWLHCSYELWKIVSS